MLRYVHQDDATSISEIYNHYILNSSATFEEDPVAPDEMRRRILETTKNYPWFVCEEDGRLIGYSYGRKWRERPAYRHSVEATVYLLPASVGKGRGTALFDVLLAELRNRQFRCVIGGVALPNPPSIALLEKFGLRQVALFKEVGYKFGRWIDVGYWQLLL
ncbi:Phosphinothricin N-acetyltransferase [Candidatus Sulfotelmatomonas gaucii]|uniref:Phosphinothricin N-acetyltransferase n=1 Tax=Candidatus Sulfuritelmatomonas gaucii TaxID=2043161 RepID=A0A2N9LDP0_9BACT|nr:Phosphinothricin N-acetyltransferase [Candidatus Sulfotelmatomonas gaucii]